MKDGDMAYPGARLKAVVYECSQEAEWWRAQEQISHHMAQRADEMILNGRC